jgi:hypothetical protein
VATGAKLCMKLVAPHTIQQHEVAAIERAEEGVVDASPTTSCARWWGEAGGALSDTVADQAPVAVRSRWARFSAALPMRTSLVAVGVVWLLGCVWSFQEQSAFAASKEFVFPHLLPLVIDGFAVSMAGVAWAASLDARPAVPARLATVIAVGASSASNGVWAYLRAHHDLVTVGLGIAVPIAANLAFEVLLAELRRQVQRRRGLPAPVPVPYPRLIRIVLAPWQTFWAWRSMVLDLTAVGGHSAQSARGGGGVIAVDGEPRTERERAEEVAAVPTESTAALALEPPIAADTASPVSASSPVSSLGRPAKGPARPSSGEPDPRVLRLAALAVIDDRDFTGESVGELLRIDIKPRTGRRLLARARELRRAEARALRESSQSLHLAAHR